MNELVNLVVDLPVPIAVEPERYVGITPAGEADERTLAWIDDEFGGWWSSEAYAGTNHVAHRNGVPIGFVTFNAKGFDFAWLRGLAREPGVGIFGPFGVTKNERGLGIGRNLLRNALWGLGKLGYARALVPAVGSEELIRYYGDVAGARVAERFDRASLLGRRSRAVVMASGSGTNLQAVLDGVGEGTLPLEVAALVTNNPKAYAIERARAAGVPVDVLPWRKTEESRASYDARLLETVRAREPDVVLLLGWMHLLAEPFVLAFPNLINLHPSFLPLDPERDDVGLPDGARIPAFRGAHAVADALAAGSPWTGATVHLVTPSTDRGPVLARKPLRVCAGESEANVMERLHPIEHRLVAAAIMRRQYERAD